MSEEKKASEPLKDNANRKIYTDLYVSDNIADEGEKFNFAVFIRLNAKGKIFRNVSFQHCVFDSCYINNCVFDTCNFTGCKFIGSNFHQSSFPGCNFRFATFERSHFDDDILEKEPPKEENLKMHFARSLRMNFQQIGNAKAVNKAITVELEATSIYLKKSWSSQEKYYRDKYYGNLNWLVQFFKWLWFSVLHIIWGNGESILKFLRTILFLLIAIVVYDTYYNDTSATLSSIWSSIVSSPAVFLGVLSPNYLPIGFLSFIAGMKLITFALLTALLVKRFSRR